MRMRERVCIVNILTSCRINSHSVKLMGNATLSFDYFLFTNALLCGKGSLRIKILLELTIPHNSWLVLYRQRKEEKEISATCQFWVIWVLKIEIGSLDHLGCQGFNPSQKFEGEGSSPSQSWVKKNLATLLPASSWLVSVQAPSKAISATKLDHAGSNLGMQLFDLALQQIQQIFQAKVITDGTPTEHCLNIKWLELCVHLYLFSDSFTHTLAKF